MFLFRFPSYNSKKLFKAQNIRSLPIIEPNSSEIRCLGIASVLDIAGYIGHTCKELDTHSQVIFQTPISEVLSTSFLFLILFLLLLIAIPAYHIAIYFIKKISICMSALYLSLYYYQFLLSDRNDNYYRFILLNHYSPLLLLPILLPISSRISQEWDLCSNGSIVSSQTWHPNSLPNCSFHSHI